MTIHVIDQNRDVKRSVFEISVEQLKILFCESQTLVRLRYSNPQTNTNSNILVPSKSEPSRVGKIEKEESICRKKSPQNRMSF